MGGIESLANTWKSIVWYYSKELEAPSALKEFFSCPFAVKQELLPLMNSREPLGGMQCAWRGPLFQVNSNGKERHCNIQLLFNESVLLGYNAYLLYKAPFGIYQCIQLSWKARKVT